MPPPVNAPQGSQFSYIKMNSPIGTLYLLASSEHLRCITFESNWKKLLDRFRLKEEDLLFSENPILLAAELQIEEYFFAGRRHFSLPLELNGTSFQRTAWTALLQIPYGETISYSAQALAAGRPSACRAVGNASRLNPLCIVVPCHRVIGRNGQLSGYAGGADAKKALLKLENPDFLDLAVLRSGKES